MPGDWCDGAEPVADDRPAGDWFAPGFSCALARQRRSGCPLRTTGLDSRDHWQVPTKIEVIFAFIAGRLSNRSPRGPRIKIEIAIRNIAAETLRWAPASATFGQTSGRIATAGCKPWLKSRWEGRQHLRMNRERPINLAMSVYEFLEESI